MARKYNATAEELSFYEDVDEPIDNLAPQLQQSMPQAPAFNDQVSFYEQAEAAPLPENIPWYQSIPSAAAKGLLNGVVSLGRMFGPLQDDDFYRRKIGLPTQNKDFREQLDEFLPSNPGFIENSLDRGLGILPLVLANPFGAVAAEGAAVAEAGAIGSQALKSGILGDVLSKGGPFIRSLLAGASGETAKELGFGPVGQGLAEIPALGLPGFSSRVNPTAAQSQTVNNARALGLTEQQLTPLIQNTNSRTVKLLSKIANKKGRSESALKDSYDALGKIYNRLETSPDALKPFSTDQWFKIGSDIEEAVAKMPAGVRNLIKEDLSDLLKGEMNGQKLINFYKDINYYVGNGERQLGLLKDPVTRGLSQAGSPQLAQDFINTTNLAQKYYSISSKLKPSVADDLINASEGVRFLYGAFTGNYPLLVETAGEAIARQAATELLVNPRFQNLSRQMVEALNNNKLPAAAKIYDSMVNYAREVDPEVAVFLQRAGFSNFANQGRSTNTQEE
jgi:hypothetical protein